MCIRDSSQTIGSPASIVPLHALQTPWNFAVMLLYAMALSLAPIAQIVPARVPQPHQRGLSAVLCAPPCPLHWPGPLLGPPGGTRALCSPPARFSLAPAALAPDRVTVLAHHPHSLDKACPYPSPCPVGC